MFSQIRNAETLDDLNEAIKNPSISAILEAQGAILSASAVSEKEGMCTLLMRHILLDSVQFLINEFKEGLETLGVLRSIQQHPETFRDVFCKSNMPVLDAQMIDLVFSPKFGEEGTNRRPLQEQAIVYWRDYLQDCAGMYGILNSIVLFNE